VVLKALLNLHLAHDAISEHRMSHDPDELKKFNDISRLNELWLFYRMRAASKI
jgi:hypothetical protein